MTLTFILGEKCEKYPSPDMEEQYDLHIGSAGAYLYSGNGSNFSKISFLNN